MRSLAFILALVALAPSSALAQQASELGDPASLPAPMLEPDDELAYPVTSLGGPFAVTIVGAVFTGAGALTLFVAGMQSADLFEDGSPEVVALAGTVVTAIGVPLLFAGIYWLMEQMDARRAADSDRASNPLLLRF